MQRGCPADGSAQPAASRAPRPEAPARTTNEARGPRRGDSRGSAARRSPAAAPRPPTSPERAGRGLPAPLSPSTGPRRLTVAATGPPSAQRPPNGHLTAAARARSAPPRAHLTEPLAPLPPAQRRVASRRTAPPPLTPPSLPRSPRAAPPQGGACAGRGLCPCTTPPCWGGGLRARTRGVEGALRGPGRLCGWGWDWMVLRAPSSPSPSLKSRSYSRKHLL